MTKKFFKFWFPVVAYSGIIFYVSGQPNLSLPGDWPFSDKLIHMLEYIPLGWLFIRALSQSEYSQNISTRRLIWLTTLFCVLYGISDEFHQSFIQGRTAELGDVLSDALGGFLGGVITKR